MALAPLEQPELKRFAAGLARVALLRVTGGPPALRSFLLRAVAAPEQAAEQAYDSCFKAAVRVLELQRDAVVQ